MGPQNNNIIEVDSESDSGSSWITSSDEEVFDLTEESEFTEGTIDIEDTEDDDVQEVGIHQILERARAPSMERTHPMGTEHDEVPRVPARTVPDNGESAPARVHVSEGPKEVARSEEPPRKRFRTCGTMPGLAGSSAVLQEGAVQGSGNAPSGVRQFRRRTGPADGHRSSD